MRWAKSVAPLGTVEGVPLHLNQRSLQRRHRNAGFTMIELMCAIVVLNLLVAGLVTLFQGQNHMVNSLEEWCEGEPVLYIAQDSDPLARSLGIPATLSKDAVQAQPLPQGFTGGSDYEVSVLEVKRRFGKSEASALFKQEEVEEEDGDEDDARKSRDKKGRGRR
ncbi:MAG: type II secretion system protein [Planctomycetota bacterium]